MHDDDTKDLDNVEMNLLDEEDDLGNPLNPSKDDVLDEDEEEEDEEEEEGGTE